MTGKLDFAVATRMAASLTEHVSSTYGEVIDGIDDAIDILANPDGTPRVPDAAEALRAASYLMAGLNKLATVLPTTLYRDLVMREDKSLEQIAGALTAAAANSLVTGFGSGKFPIADAFNRLQARALAENGEHARRSALMMESINSMAKAAGVDPADIWSGKAGAQDALVESARANGTLEVSAASLANALGLEPGSLHEVAPGMFTATLEGGQVPDRLRHAMETGQLDVGGPDEDIAPHR